MLIANDKERLLYLASFIERSQLHDLAFFLCAKILSVNNILCFEQLPTTNI